MSPELQGARVFLFSLEKPGSQGAQMLITQGVISNH
eukprot:SAG31_NODE_24766_length_474_cov_1.101333_2_plen_35_part_01